MIFVGRLFGFPISIQPMAFLLLAVIVAADMATGGVVGAGFALVKMLLLFSMVLVHELGHALVARRYDRREIEIVLTALGGVTLTRAPPTALWGLAMTLAGPFAGFLLGAAAALVLFLTPESRFDQFGVYLVVVSVFWSAFNLLPMYPLDGGQALVHVLRLKLAEGPAVRWGARVGVVTAGIVGGAGIATGQFFIALIAVLALTQSFPLAFGGRA